MFFIIATVISAVFLCLALILAVRIARLPYRSSRFITPSRVLAVGVFLAGWTLYFPHYFIQFDYQNLFARIWESFWVSAHHTIRLFVIDTGFEEIFYSATVNGGKEAYAILGTILFILAPIMTAGVILSFFKNFVAYLKCLAKRKEDAYIFSELSEKSLALATDLSEKHKSAAIIFCDVFAANEESSYELCERAHELGAVCFRKDIAALNLAFFAKTSFPLLFCHRRKGRRKRQASLYHREPERRVCQEKQRISLRLFHRRAK